MNVQPHTLDGEIASIEATLQTYYAEYGHDWTKFPTDVRLEYRNLRERLVRLQEKRATPADAWFLGRPDED